MLKQVEITILVENSVNIPSLRAEKALSFHIASPEGDFLFDTGHQEAFLHNAERLGIDLGKVRKILFSHGHSDHTGGLFHYLQKFAKAKVICHYNIFNRKFRVYEGGYLEVGIPYGESELKKLGGEFIYKTHPYNLSKNILSSGEIPRLKPNEITAQIHKELVLEDYITDKLRDDMSMVIKTVKGLIVLLGDSHSGPINTVKHAMRIAGINEVYAVLGGMNLIDASMETIEKIARKFEQINPRYLIPLHSTGFRAMANASLRIGGHCMAHGHSNWRNGVLSQIPQRTSSGRVRASAIALQLTFALSVSEPPASLRPAVGYMPVPIGPNGAVRFVPIK